MKRLINIIQEKLILSKTRVHEYPNDEYLYHEALKDGYTTMFVGTENILQYSIDNCKTWHNLEPDMETPEINKYERIYFRGENMKIKIDGIGNFQSNKKFNVGGNVMSLIYGDDFKGKTKLLLDKQFNSLFYDNYYLISAENLILPATKLTDGCYEYMFAYCTSLTKSPILPAKKLVEYCYYQMFVECSSLNEITMLATDISAAYCLQWWVDKISQTGIFTKAKGVDILADNDGNGIPVGWDVKEI